MSAQGSLIQDFKTSSFSRRPVLDHREKYLAEKKPIKIIYVGRPLPRDVQAFHENTPDGATLVASGGSLADFSSLKESDWEDIEVIVISPRPSETVEELVSKASGVKWIHSIAAGVNHLRVPSVLTLDIPITHGKGILDNGLAEFVLLACNYFAKNCPRLLETKKAKKWDVLEVEELRGTTMSIIGFGGIGLTTAKLAKAFRMKIIGVRRHLELSDDEKLVVDEIYRPEELNKVMRMSDYVVNALPLLPNTKAMIDVAAIDAMQPHAVFINVGRGATVDESALIKALKEKKIRGAGLDVFEEEPLPQTSPLYELDNVLISCHNAWNTTHARSYAFNRFFSLLKKYKNGEELENLIDIKQGY